MTRNMSTWLYGKDYWSLGLEGTLYLSFKSPSKSSFQFVVTRSWTPLCDEGQLKLIACLEQPLNSINIKNTTLNMLDLLHVFNNCWCACASENMRLMKENHKYSMYPGKHMMTCTVEVWEEKSFKVCFNFWKLSDVGFTIPHLQGLKSKQGNCFCMHPIQPPRRGKWRI